MDIKKIVNSLVKKHKTRNPFEIIKGLNVILVPVPLEGVRGFYQYFQRNNIIYIDDSLPEHEQILVCAHELGHMLLHKKANALFMDTYTGFNTTKYEKEADLFAMELLVSDETILEFQEYTTEQIALALWYTEKLIKLRLKSK
jgi:Zn-dependent peptidase ImmA (M78 family)